MKQPEIKNKKIPHIVMCIIGIILLIVGIFVLTRYDRSIVPDVIDGHESYDTSTAPGVLSVIAGSSFLLAGIYNLIKMSKNPKAVSSISSYIFALLLVIILSIVAFVILFVAK